MLGLLHAVTVMDNLRRIPLVVMLARWIPAKFTNNFKHRMIQFVKVKAAA
jgi:hypothetical protein